MRVRGPKTTLRFAHWLKELTDSACSNNIGKIIYSIREKDKSFSSTITGSWAGVLQIRLTKKD